MAKELTSIRRAFEAAGVIFIEEDERWQTGGTVTEMRILGGLKAAG
jgi:hypothetical protein